MLFFLLVFFDETNVPYAFMYYFRSANMTTAERSHLVVESVVNKAVAPAICVFGIIGNLLNLVVLTRKRLQCSMDRMEKSFHVT